MTGVFGVSIHVNKARTRTVTRRTWAQRLFSWPWRPWVAVIESDGEYLLPDGQVWKSAEGLWMNPNTYEKLKQQVTAK